MRLPALAVGDTHAGNVQAGNLSIDELAHLTLLLEPIAADGDGHVTTHAQLNFNLRILVLLLLSLDEEVSLVLVELHVAKPEVELQPIHLLRLEDVGRTVGIGFALGILALGIDVAGVGHDTFQRRLDVASEVAFLE